MISIDDLIMILTDDLIISINNFLLTEREVFTEKYRTEVVFVQTEPVGRGLLKKAEVRYFSVKTEQARLINKTFINYMALFIGIYTRNKNEMHDLKSVLVAWYKFGRRKQKLPMYSFLST